MNGDKKHTEEELEQIWQEQKRKEAAECSNIPPELLCADQITQRALKFSSDSLRGVITVDFGVNLTCVTLDAKGARDFGYRLLQEANRISTEVEPVTEGFAVAIDKDNGIVRICFPKPLPDLGMEPREAVQAGKALIEYAATLAGKSPLELYREMLAEGK